MKIIVDTCIWSLSLRRKIKPTFTAIGKLQELINDGRVQMLGPIRQEILSGIKSVSQFEKLRSILKAFPDLELTMEDYETAAGYYNLCRSNGVQGSNTDFLICAAASRHKMPIFTIDKDFPLFQKYVNIDIISPSD